MTKVYSISFACWVIPFILAIDIVTSTSTRPSLLELSTLCNDDVTRLIVSFWPGTDLSCGDSYVFAEFKKHTGPPDVVKYIAAKSDGYYTLMMVDPDAPTRKNPTARYWLHWLLTNLKGSDLQIGNIKDGDVIMDYNPPAPPVRSGPHRYFFLLFRQDGLLPGNPPPMGRAKFNIIKFAEDYHLSMHDVAVNMFITENRG